MAAPSSDGKESSAIHSRLSQILSDAERSGVTHNEIMALLDLQKEPSARVPGTAGMREFLYRALLTSPAKWYLVPFLLVTSIFYIPTLQLWNHSSCIFPAPVIMVQPLADCAVCRGVTGAPRLVGISRKNFSLHHAHSSRPIVVVGAALDWPALEIFSYEYFRGLYQNFPDAIDSDTSKGQFFAYSSNIPTLKDLFQLSPERAAMTTESWYIGWSTSDPQVGKELKSHISVPYFLSPANRNNELIWIFMGAPGPGASMHIDSVSEPSWQAQISGTKTWTLMPPMECESVCTQFNVTVNKGDIIVVDTNRWYHETFVHEGNFSITIGAEYH